MQCSTTSLKKKKSSLCFTQDHLLLVLLLISVPKSTHTQWDNIAQGYCLPVYFFPGGSIDKESACYGRAAGDMDSIPLWVGKSSGEGNDNPLQYSCLDNSMDRGAQWATVNGVTKSWTWLSTHMHICISVAGDLWGQEKINVKACVDDYKNNF